MVDASSIRERYAAVGRGLNERARRLFAAAEARTAGYRGIAASSRATGLAPSTIGRGLKDLNEPGSLSGKVRRPGSGRPALTAKDPTLLEDLRRLLEPATVGDEKPREAGSGTVQTLGGSSRLGKGRVCIGKPVKSMPEPGAERAVVAALAKTPKHLSGLDLPRPANIR